MSFVCLLSTLCSRRAGIRLARLLLHRKGWRVRFRGLAPASLLPYQPATQLFPNILNRPIRFGCLVCDISGSCTIWGANASVVTQKTGQSGSSKNRQSLRTLSRVHTNSSATTASLLGLGDQSAPNPRVSQAQREIRSPLLVTRIRTAVALAVSGYSTEPIEKVARAPRMTDEYQLPRTSHCDVQKVSLLLDE